MECGICWNLKEPVYLSCNHAFCKQCLQKQIIRDSKCAICRTNMTSCNPNICDDTTIVFINIARQKDKQFGIHFQSTLTINKHTLELRTGTEL